MSSRPSTIPAVVTAALLWVAPLAALAAEPAGAFGTPGGPPPANVDEIVGVLRQDPYDLELLISFGTSKGGSAGHLALALRDAVEGDDLVYSANFYADRDPRHEASRYTEELMARIPKKEYLFATASSLGPKASFGLDFGEVYKRSVVGVRVYGVPAAEKQALADFFGRVNEDYHRRAAKAEYHDREVKYGYMHLNCAKTIGAAFRYGAGYTRLQIKEAAILPARTVVVAGLNANLPTEMALKLLKEWHARGYRFDAVMYRKSPGSPYVDPHEEDKVAFKDLPNRFPSVLSRDFRNDEGHYQDYDNLFAMYLLYNLAKYSVRVDPAAGRLEFETRKEPMAYGKAVELAGRSARADSRGFLRRLQFRPQGHRIGDAVEGQ
jgi:hypothetical protein